MDAVELMLAVFEEEGRVEKVLRDLKRLEKDRTLRLFDAAMLVKDRNGIVRLKETRDVGAGRGALFGAIAGGLVGLLGGPAGVIVGAAAGAAAGGVTASKIDLGFSNQFLDEIKTHLQPGSSALLALVEQEWAERLAQELQRYPGQLFRHALKAEIVKQLIETQRK
ncbi:MAG: DUF1269 domain-containing protein [Anaerolineales bacterium]|nr:DUF1269 domain-containing protein [Anaerolineales bacterium]